ncbi:MAG: xanthine dehydrogenase family protein molybdopterin-binding subunit [Synergistaceae bacterium]|nr:xanthine dehydrogenase family protein molybdopterin-binding subunit [Synergistaceae bacterium]
MSDTFSVTGRSLPRHDGLTKAAGEAPFIADLDVPGAWTAGVLRSPVAAGRLRGITGDPAFDWTKVVVVTAEDLPGPNVVSMVRDDYEILARDRIRFATQALAIVAAPDATGVAAALAHLRVDIVEEAPLLTIEDALEAKTVIWAEEGKAPNVIDEFFVRRGDVQKGFEEADVVVEGTYRTPYQEHVCLETQGMIAWPKADGVEIEGSMQCPWYVHEAVARALKLDAKNVTVRQSTTGGGFGGREDYPSVMAVWVALLARACGHPVKLIYDRTEDLLCTTKRHPSKIFHRTGVKRDGTITAVEIDLLLDGGAATSMSRVVLSRAILHSGGAYRIPNASIHARAVATNTPPNGAFRGFGAPQSLFAMERQMDKIASTLGMTPLELRLKNVMRPGDSFPFGQVMDEGVEGAAWVLNDVVERADYRRKYGEYKKRTGRVRRGVGLSLCMHGGGFTGSGEDTMGTVVEVEYTPGGVLDILSSSTDMGQGASTVLPMIAAEALGLSPDRVRHPRPDTSKVPNSGPTVASRTTMYVGSVVRDAALDLVERLRVHVAETKKAGSVTYKNGNFWGGGNEILAGFDEAASDWLTTKGRLVGRAAYKPDPAAAWDDEKYEGRAYRAYSWMAQVVEIEVDCDTYEITPLESTVSAEVGRAINPIQAVGQIEGGVLQSYGWSCLEDLSLTPDGKYSAGHLNGYLIPTTLDAPKFSVKLFEDPCPVGAYGAKGIGELPMDGGAPAMAAAVENALGVFATKIPLTGEELHGLLTMQGREETGT